ncbi:MAG: phosphoesterase [Planctomycetes bacterium]|nr:phosphoesterase [Planctomycetota bacterium]
MKSFPLPLFLALVCACAAPEQPAPSESDAPVGPRAQGGYVLPTRQVVEPAGTTLAFDGRPLDLVVSPDGRFVFVKEKGSVLTIDAHDTTLVSRYRAEKLACSMHGLALAGDKLYLTGTEDQLFELALAADGSLAASRTLRMPQAEVGGDPYPCGVALGADAATALVCLSRGNALALVDLRSGNVTATIPVGIAPYDVVLSPDGRSAYVSNFGGRHAVAGDKTAPSSDTPLVVDERGVGASGTISVVDLEARACVAEIACGLHPCDLVLTRDGSRLYAAAANSDAVFVLDTRKRRVVEEICVRPDPALPFGSLTNAIALSPDEHTLYAANGGNNALAVVQLGRADSNTLAGFIPTGAFPGAIAVSGERLFVANVKGEGSRATKDGQKGWHSPNERGSVSCIPGFDAQTLAQWTERALRNARVPQAQRAAAARAGTGVAARPVPRKVGEPSTIEHVVYVIKENRTYDQVFGDLAQANGDPSLCIFGREVTPNQHALAERFVLLDNYYCNGVVSADGHQWATQGVVVDYLEKQFGGWTRSYDLGTDALTYASNGFLWDAVLLRGLSFRNYGEMDFAHIDAPKGTWFDVQQAVRDGGFRSSRRISPDELARYSAPDYPGWNMAISDQLRIDRFLDEFREMEKSGEFPSFTIVYLPQDHTSGLDENSPTPRAHVADNDLAVGRLIEALSKSRFWARTAVFINEDDPQNGWDHVDGHRSTCLVVSPWAKRGAVLHRFYNQTSVLRTMELILGLPPLSQQDAAAASMDECFTDEPDFTSFVALPNSIPLDERNPKKTALANSALPLLAESDAQDLSVPDRIDDDVFNRVIWYSVRGEQPYPARFAGAHGRGLESLGLELSDEGAADDDDD